MTQLTKNLTVWELYFKAVDQLSWRAFSSFYSPDRVGTPNLDSLNVNKRADYSSYNTAVDLLTALSDVIDKNI